MIELSCADCIHFNACARWNVGQATDMMKCEHFKPMCENCSAGECSSSSKRVHCLIYGDMKQRNFFCKCAAARTV